jgi:hypothetical protein
MSYVDHKFGRILSNFPLLINLEFRYFNHASQYIELDLKQLHNKMVLAQLLTNNKFVIHLSDSRLLFDES